MPQHPPDQQFGPFVLSSRQRRVLRDGEEIPLTPKAFDVLQVLITHSGELVEKQELTKAVWGDGFVDDSTVTQNIFTIRKALGSAAFIETVPKRGYRFTAEAVPLIDKPLRTSAPGGTKKLFLAGLAGAMIIAAVLWWTLAHPLRFEVASLTPLVTLPGDKTDPAVSPDGSMLAFSWRGEKGGPAGIYVAPIRGGAQRRLTQSPSDDISPAWDPTGRRVAFLRVHPGQTDELMQVSVEGENAEKIRDLRLPEWVRRNPRPLFAWTPEGKGWIAPMEDATGRTYSLYRFDAGGAPQLFLPTPAGSFGIVSTVWSADGGWIAYVRREPSGLFLQRMSTKGEPEGEPIEASKFSGGLVFEPDSAFSTPVLSPDGSQLWFVLGSRVYVADPSSRTLQSVYVAPQQLQGLTAHWKPGSSVPDVFLTAVGGVYELRSLEINPDGHRSMGASHSLVLGGVPAVSPDGQWVAYSSVVNGAMEIFISRTSTGPGRPVTRLEARVATNADWSPDGKHIALHARRAGVTQGTAQIYVIDLDPLAEISRPEGSPPLATTRQLTASPASLAGPRWSPDAKYLYATKLPNEITRVNVATGEVERLFEGDSAVPFGKRLFYGRDGQFGLFARSLEGDVRSNAEERILSDYVPPRGFDVGLRGIYYLGRGASRQPEAIRFFDFTLQKSFDLAPPARGALPAITAAPDGRHVYFDNLPEGSGALTWMRLRSGR